MLSCAATTARCRSSAWAKTSARSRRRAVRRSDHSRPSRDGADHETSEHGPAAAERDHGHRSGAEVPERLAVDDRLIGQIGQPRQMDHVTLAKPRGEPGALDRPDHRRAARHAIASPRLREPGLVAPLVQRPERGPVDTEALPDQLESSLDGFLGLGGSARREPGREVGQERLESQALGEALLGPAALGPLDQQPPDEPALEEQRAEGAQHDDSVPLPQRGLPEPDDAAGGQPAEIEPPALDLARVEDGHAGAHVRRRRALPGEHLKGQLRSHPAVRLEARDVTPDDPGPDRGLREGVDGDAGGGRDPGHGLRRGEVPARRIAEEDSDHHDRPSGQAPHIRDDLVEAEVGEIDDLDRIPGRRELFAGSLHPDTVGR